jgi:AcrR family transcriptional regulator
MALEQPTQQVNARRAYNSHRRRQRSHDTHNALLDAAQRRFLERGYSATTIDSIAADASVSPATIYKTYGSKAGLVRALCERALAGRGPLPAEQRSDTLQANEPDPRKIIAGWGRLTAEVAPRIAPILLLLRNAADGDSAAATLLAELDEERHTRMTHNARSLVAGGHTRPGIRLSEASDVLWTYSSPELYDLLVRRRNWTIRRYSTFIADAITRALL